MRPSTKSVAIRLAFTLTILTPAVVQGQGISPSEGTRDLRRHLVDRLASSPSVEERSAILERLSRMNRISSRRVFRLRNKRIRKRSPESFLSPYKHLFGTLLDEVGLGRSLTKLLQRNDALLLQVFNQIAPTDRDDVAFEILHRIGEKELRGIARRPSGRHMLHRLTSELNRGFVSAREITQILRLIRILSPTHGFLANDLLPGTVVRALSVAGAKHQPIQLGWGPLQVDEYAITIERMPPDLTPEHFLRELARDLNRAVNDREFDRINRFVRRTTPGKPRTGDIVDIDILGPDNGSVVLREITDDHFVFSTIETSRTGTHPEYGNRSFGFHKNPDGSVTFTTRGVSRPADPAVGLAGSWPQCRSWTRLVRGIGKTIEARGGRPLPHSFRIRKGF